MPQKATSRSARKSSKRKYPIVEIEDVSEPFCGVRRKNLVPLIDADPQVAYEWCYEKNAGWGPEHFSRASGVKAWWRCSACNRVYKAQINNRTVNKSECPYCKSKLVCDDNSLVMRYPAVAREWHPRKNGKLKPGDVMYASGLRAWWLCATCGHEWNAVISTRTTQEACCPACYESRMEYAREHPREKRRNRISLNEKSKAPDRSSKAHGVKYDRPLSRTHPKIAKEWHPTKNGQWSARDLSAGSDTKVWWKCAVDSGHEWQAPVYIRTGRGSGCPYCAGKRASDSNSLKAMYPEVAKLWHFPRNAGLKPGCVTAHSSRSVWWRCRKDQEHIWRTKIAVQVKSQGCPFCARTRASEEYNLKALYPDVARQWHTTLNGPVKPEQVLPSSSKKFWWRCKVGPDHVWSATPANRTGLDSGCPFCSGRKASVTNSLAKLYPKIAREWDKNKNGSLRPADVTAGSGKEIWWRCSEGHAWKMTVHKRTSRRTGCPRCR